MKSSNLKSEVVILAGGFGSRLADVIGADTPKPMALIDGRPLLEYQIKLCVDHGFDRILILLHYKPEIVISYFGEGESFGAQIRYSIEATPRGTAGAIFDSLDLLVDSFLVIYGDTFLDVNLRKFFDYKRPDAAVLAFCHPNSHPFDSDLLAIDQNGKVKRVFRPSMSGEQYYRNLVNAALYVIDKKAISNLVPPVGQIDISSDLFPLLIKESEQIQTYISAEYIKDMGTPDRYHAVDSEVKRGIPSLFSDTGQRKCVFLDRDGVINKEVGHLSNIDEFQLLDNVGQAVACLNNMGYLVICVTNQPVIARGELTEEGLSLIHMKMEAELGKDGAYLDRIYYCPHHPESGFEGEIPDLKIHCECRKPKPGMLMLAIEEFGIDPAASWIVGDNMRDILAGQAIGVRTILVGDSSFVTSEDQCSAINHADSLLSATQFILSND